MHPRSAAASGRGGLVSNGFLSQKALVSNLARHYQQQGLKEAHKVLGGAGPAVASVPLTVLWAGGSAFALLASITKGNTGPVVAAQQLCYVPLMTLSMVRWGAGAGAWGGGRESWRAVCDCRLECWRRGACVREQPGTAPTPRAASRPNRPRLHPSPPRPRSCLASRAWPPPRWPRCRRTAPTATRTPWRA